MIEQKVIIEGSTDGPVDLEEKINERLKKSYPDWKVKQISLSSKGEYFYISAAVLLERKITKKKENGERAKSHHDLL